MPYLNVGYTWPASIVSCVCLSSFKAWPSICGCGELPGPRPSTDDLFKVTEVRWPCSISCKPLERRCVACKLNSLNCIGPQTDSEGQEMWPLCQNLCVWLSSWSRVLTAHNCIPLQGISAVKFNTNRCYAAHLYLNFTFSGYIWSKRGSCSVAVLCTADVHLCFV